MKISAFLLCILAISSGVFAESGPYYEIKGLGFAPTYTKPGDFSASMANGGEKALSEYKGRWILLAFWATWCGPCQYELPILERLHQKFKSKGLSVLGVSIDQEGSEKHVRKFLIKNKISFPQFLDGKGKIASRYFASSVPSLYLISPDWKLVGVSRGAKDWGTPKVLNSVEKLLSFKEVPENDLIAENSFSLPENLVPPILKAVLSKNVITEGESINLEIFVQWKGKLEQYLFKVPKPHLPSDIITGSVSSESLQQKGTALLKYVYPLKFKSSGEKMVGPVEMEFKSRLGGGFLTTRIPGKKVYVKGFPWARILLWIVGAITFCCFIFLLWKLKVKEKESKTKENTVSSMLQDEWMEVKKKIDKNSWESGEKAGQLIFLNFHLKALKALGEDSGKTEKLIDQVQYGNLSIGEGQFSLMKNELDNRLKNNL